MANMKYELIAEIENQIFYIASFNHMGNTLCESFEIRNEEGTILNSGCVAFGIDRWAYALLLKHGTDLEEWPPGLKQLFFPEG
ncbi:hypothetical protein D3H35_01720 [Cohnella faecalis]|uniref:Aminoacyl-tRNA synthetase class II (G/ P/ S/T) domain-containing protein n=1 Tax=Cohnella faecalis TaxID=2315694 RepID=A0A398CRQ2_9BACL|nr:hypothetical protein D3H35_01720 [Cohnella faecalis]